MAKPDNISTLNINVTYYTICNNILQKELKNYNTITANKRLKLQTLIN